MSPGKGYIITASLQDQLDQIPTTIFTSKEANLFLIRGPNY